MFAGVFSPANCHLKLAVCVLVVESSQIRLGFVAVNFPQRHLRLMVFTLVVSLTIVVQPRYDHFSLTKYGMDNKSSFFLCDIVLIKNQGLRNVHAVYQCQR